MNLKTALLIILLILTTCGRDPNTIPGVTGTDQIPPRGEVYEKTDQSASRADDTAPSPTPVPTVTPAPTATPVPTVTPSPSPTPTPCVGKQHAKKGCK